MNGHSTTVVSAPIGVDYDRIARIAADPGLGVETARLRRELRLDTPGLDIIGVGVDRLDYTKGIPERLCAIDRLLTQPSRAAAPARVRPGRRAVAFEAGKLCVDREGDRRTRRRHQRSPWRRAGPRPDPLSKSLAQNPPARGTLPARQLLHRQLAPRRDESRRQGVRRRPQR